MPFPWSLTSLQYELMKGRDSRDARRARRDLFDEAQNSDRGGLPPSRPIFDPALVQSESISRSSSHVVDQVGPAQPLECQSTFAKSKSDALARHAGIPAWDRELPRG